MVGLRDAFGLKCFIETGTNRGHTTQMAGLAFREVHTVEIDPERFAAAVEKFRGMPGVHCHLGDTRQWMRAAWDFAAMPPSLIYLDAHWPDGDWSDEVANPLAEELSIIGSLYGKHCIVIDDNSPADMEPLVKHFTPHVFGVKQFCVLAPGPCDWRNWTLEVPQ
jgi:hypothetical protein